MCDCDGDDGVGTAHFERAEGEPEGSGPEDEEGSGHQYVFFVNLFYHWCLSL